MLNSFEELKARLSTTDVELISIAQLDVPPPPSAPPLCAMPPVPDALEMVRSERALTLTRTRTRTRTLTLALTLTLTLTRTHP